MSPPLSSARRYSCTGYMPCHHLSAVPEGTAVQCTLQFTNFNASGGRINLLKYWWSMPLFLFIFISQICIETSKVYIQYFALGLHGGVDVKWSRGLLVLDMHWREIVPLPNEDRQCGHYSQQPNGEILYAWANHFYF
jgi:hypothetical protein